MQVHDPDTTAHPNRRNILEDAGDPNVVPGHAIRRVGDDALDSWSERL